MKSSVREAATEIRPTDPRLTALMEKYAVLEARYAALEQSQLKLEAQLACQQEWNEYAMQMIAKLQSQIAPADFKEEV
ncbi:MAG TPA: hypothetical protein V6D19_07175 [Stenomitos sp.]